MALVEGKQDYQWCASAIHDEMSDDLNSGRRQ